MMVFSDLDPIKIPPESFLSFSQFNLRQRNSGTRRLRCRCRRFRCCSKDLSTNWVEGRVSMERDQCFKSCSCVLTHCLCFSIREYVSFLNFVGLLQECVKDEFFLVCSQKRSSEKRTTPCLCFRCKVPLEGGIWSATPHVLRCMLLALRQKPKHPQFNPSCNPSFTRSRVHVGDFENVERSLCLHLILGIWSELRGNECEWRIV